VATVASWPIEIDPAATVAGAIDAWTTTVRSAIEDLRHGRLDRAALVWHDDATWIVRCIPAHEQTLTGVDAIVERLRVLGTRTGNTFRQRLVALTGSDGPIVTVYVRTLARRGHRTLDQPSLLVFELASGRIRRVTELPGDVPAWCRFWED
jgi:hypothetical protein